MEKLQSSFKNMVLSLVIISMVAEWLYSPDMKMA